LTTTGLVHVYVYDFRLRSIWIRLSLGTRNEVAPFQMPDHEAPKNTYSQTDEHEVYDPVKFDPECTSDDDAAGDPDTLAFRDAARDIWTTEGRFEVLMF
jgi:hypothetical protein